MLLDNTILTTIGVIGIIMIIAFALYYSIRSFFIVSLVIFLALIIGKIENYIPSWVIVFYVILLGFVILFSPYFENKNNI